MALDVAVDAERPKARFLRGASDANCKTVETLWGGRGSGVPGLELFRRMSMKPYRSTSFPSTSSQSSMPPASSCSCLVDMALCGLANVPLGVRRPFALDQSAWL